MWTGLSCRAPSTGVIPRAATLQRARESFPRRGNCPRLRSSLPDVLPSWRAPMLRRPDCVLPDEGSWRSDRGSHFGTPFLRQGGSLTFASGFVTFLAGESNSASTGLELVMSRRRAVEAERQSSWLCSEEPGTRSMRSLLRGGLYLFP